VEKQNKNKKKRYRIDYRHLPAECRAMIDVINLMESDEELLTKESLQKAIGDDEKIMQQLLDKEISSTFKQSTINAHLDNYTRLIRAKEFIELYIQPL